MMISGVVMAGSGPGDDVAALRRTVVFARVDATVVQS